METKIFKPNEIHLLADLAKEGAIIAFPTETVYGLGVVYDNEEAFNNLVKVKDRKIDKPFTLMLDYTRDIGNYAILNNKITNLIDVFMPGELTLIIEAKPNLPKHVTLGSKYIGIRVSANYQVANLLNLVGKPLLVPSANKRDEKPALTCDEVYENFKGEIAGILEGKTTSHIPSTIIKVSDKIELIREGSIPFNLIQEVWEEEV
ncbi:MAG: Threonylcarbamoyl-AMP synthase [Tenericutes bacterium ADurb.Bin239]|jgi:L-threonylcarbamoyladenylate synthase|nr:MAG: Threonylcarbamoyl-AMP synthase [Tenericutes bacterium ADurb.Bin239]